MTILAGIISYSDAFSPKDKASKLARDTARYPTLTARPLYSNQWAALYVVERQDDNPQELSCSMDIDSKSWIIGDINYAPESILSPFKRQLDAGTAIPNGIPGRWLAVQINLRSKILRITSDRLGLGWLYIARIPNGYAFSGDFAALVEQLSKPLRVNYESCIQELALGYTLGDKTVFEEITLIPPGTVIELSQDGIRTVSKQAIEYGDRYAYLSDQQKFELFDDLYKSVVDRHFKPYEESLLVSISGGYDSRHALALLQKYSIQAKYFTFGDPASNEVQRAHLNCSRANTTTNVFTFQKGDWGEWRRCILQVGNTGITQMIGWSDSWHALLRKHGRYLVTGIFGGPLTGSHLGYDKTAGVDWFDYWLKRSTTDEWISSMLLRDEVRKHLKNLIHDHMKEMLQDVCFAFPYQQAMHFDLYSRQRRWTGAQPALMSRYLTPIIFLYDDDLFEFWINLSFEDLYLQRLYLAYARSRFPHLFPENATPPKEAPPPTLGNRMINKLRQLFKSYVLFEKQRPKPQPIDHDKIIIPNKANIINLAKAVAPVANDFIDVEKFCSEVQVYKNSNVISSYEIIRAVNLFQLLSLASGYPGHEE